MKVGSQVLYPKESYDLVACAYAVYNDMKYGHHERNYQRAYAIEIERKGFSFRREVCVRVSYRGQEIGKYFLDFLVAHKIVIELKVGNDFHTQYIKQVLNYLHSTNKRLGIIFLFTPIGVAYKRVVV